MRVTIVVPSLSVGGAERTAVVLSEFLNNFGHSVACVAIRSARGNFYSVPHGVEYQSLGEPVVNARGIGRAIIGNLKRLCKLRKKIRSTCPDVVVSLVARTNIRVILACLGAGLPVIVAERNDIKQDIGRFWRLIRPVVYRFSSAIVVQTARNAAGFRQAVGSSVPFFVIPNAVQLPRTQPGSLRGGADKPAWWPQSRVILAVGKLEKQKGFDMLLRAFSACGDAVSDYSLVIVGEGTQRRYLSDLGTELGVSERVVMPGVVNDPFPLYQLSDMFVLASRFEGFPNVLLEAMASGCPCISYDCPSGPAEIITHGQNGILVPPEDESGLSTAISRLAADPKLRTALGTKGQETTARFAPEIIMPMWEHVLSSAGGRTNKTRL